MARNNPYKGKTNIYNLENFENGATVKGTGKKGEGQGAAKPKSQRQTKPVATSQKSAEEMKRDLKKKLAAANRALDQAKTKDEKTEAKKLVAGYQNQLKKAEELEKLIKYSEGFSQMFEREISRLNDLKPEDPDYAKLTEHLDFCKNEYKKQQESLSALTKRLNEVLSEGPSKNVEESGKSRSANPQNKDKKEGVLQKVSGTDSKTSQLKEEDLATAREALKKAENAYNEALVQGNPKVIKTAERRLNEAKEAVKALEPTGEDKITSDKENAPSWKEVWDFDKEIRYDLVRKLNLFVGDKKSEEYERIQNLIQKYHQIIEQDDIMRENNPESDLFKNAEAKRRELEVEADSLFREMGLKTGLNNITPEGEKPVDTADEKGSEEGTPKKASAESEKEGQGKSGNKVAKKPADGMVSDGESKEGPPVSAPETSAKKESAPALTEAEKAYDDATKKLKIKEIEKEAYEVTRTSWESEHKAAMALKGFKARKKRARCRAEELAAQAKVVRAEGEISLLKHLVNTSSEWVNAEKAYGADDSRTKNAKEIYEATKKQYDDYVKNTGGVQLNIDSSLCGGINKNKGGEEVLSPAKPSKIKEWFKRNWKKLGLAAGVALPTAAALIFAFVGVNPGDSQDQPSNNDGNTQEEQNEEDISTPDPDMSEEAFTEADRSKVQNALADKNLIDSEKVTITGLETFAYQGNMTLVYLETEDGTMIKYQTSVTRDKIADLREAGMSDADILEQMIKDNTLNRKNATYYYRVDESLAKLNEEAARRADGKLMSAGQGELGNNYAVYYSIENTQDLVNANHHGSVDLVVIGDNAIVELPNTVTYQTKHDSSFLINDGGKEALLAAVEKELGGDALAKRFNGQVRIEQENATDVTAAAAAYIASKEEELSR